MIKIGQFTHFQDEREEFYSGVIKTMSVLSETIRIVRGGRGNGGDYRVLSLFGDEEIEIGAAWNRTNSQGGEYVEVMIDDPSLPAALHADLVRRRFDDDSFNLCWTRPQPKEV